MSTAIAFVLRWSVEAAILAAVAIAVSRIAGRRSAALRAAILLVALVKFAIPPSLPFWPSVSRLIGWSLLDVVIDVSSWFVRPGWWPRWTLSASLTLVIVSVWLAGALVVIARLAREWRAVRDLRKTATTIGALPGGIALRSSPRVRSAFACGVFVREIVVSAGTAGNRCVLAHEVAHHRRGDVVVAYAEAALLMLWWWHPPFRALIAELREAREEAADALAMRDAALDSAEYARSLLEAASTSPAGLLGAAFGARGLRRRIVRIMGDARHAVLMPAEIVVLAGAALLVLPEFLSRPGMDALLAWF